LVAITNRCVILAIFFDKFRIFRASFPFNLLGDCLKSLKKPDFSNFAYNEFKYL